MLEVWVRRRSTDLVLYILSFVVPFTVYALTLNGYYASDHPNSMLDLQYSLLVNHTPILPSWMASNSVDVSLYHGVYSSAIAPGASILSAPFGAVGILLDKQFTLFGWQRLFDELFVALCASLSSLLVFRVARMFWGAKASFFASLTFSFGTLVWPYATVLFQHDVATLFVLLGAYFSLRGKPRSAGFTLGVAMLVDYTATLFFIPYVWLAQKKWGLRGVVNLSLGCVLSGWTGLAYNFWVFKNPLIFPEEYWVGAHGSLFSRFTPSLAPEHFALLLFSPYRGLALFSPILVVGAVSLYHMSRSPKLYEAAVFFASLFTVNLVFYSFWGDWRGGLSYGPRFMVDSTPFLAIPIAGLVEGCRQNWVKPPVFALYAYSVFVQAIGSFTDVFSGYGGWRFYQPFDYNLGLLLRGRLSVWWIDIGVGEPLYVKYVFVLCTIVIVYTLGALALWGFGFPAFRWLNRPR
ncbi:hypothetical protein B9Q04_00120 [Candidatus Marsarchaeota G2 archaeon BE_D]|jgi:hypothetical protein|uniref:Glycosyltransferase RgtA/B/C/D-like domain-containing protein n=6 Tax=Candidatus Marsarchaeota group 2 TaxID=2203771 RepID=A0A2R6CF73_9ARCH|nr:MAG: hypothetical protein B9Q04_00120 [Candidatus Marsarchaeota G2 archaeon BE_D]